jgi:RNA polymerase sigma-32 factor
MDTTTELDPLKSYFTEISKYPLLTADEERELAELAHFGGNKEAIEKLVTSNLRLVVKMAMTHHNGRSNILDLIQEGNVGLIHAAGKYDPRKGAKFSTYASFWIRAYILKHVMNAWSIVKIGTTQTQRKLFYGLNKAKKRFQRDGIEPEVPMLAEALGVKEQDIEDIQMRLSSGCLSLDDSNDWGDETDNQLETCQRGVTIEEIVAAKEGREALIAKIRKFKARINYRDRFILENRIISEEPLTLGEIGKQFGISRERVRQVENTICQNLRQELKQTAEASPTYRAETSYHRAKAVRCS